MNPSAILKDCYSGFLVLLRSFLTFFSVFCCLNGIDLYSYHNPMKRLLPFIAVLLFSFSVHSQVYTLPYATNFDSAAVDNSTFGPGSEPFPVATGGVFYNDWVNEQADAANQDWYGRTTGTGSSNTGPTTDHSGNGGAYLFVEDGWGNNTDVTLLSPQINLTGITTGVAFNYWAHSRTSSNPGNYMLLDIYDGTSWILAIDSFATLSTTDTWIERTIDVGAYTGDTVQFRFRGHNATTSFQHDIAIDDVSIFQTVFSANISAATANLNCFGDNSGSISVSTSFASPPITYNWSTGDTSSTVNGLVAGTYTVTVSDGAGASDTLMHTITGNSDLITYFTANSPSCLGGSDGSIVLDSANGATPLLLGGCTDGTGFSCAGPSNSASLGTDTLVNSNTGYPAIYGNWYWGAKHQIIYRASELNAMGMTGSSMINSIAFDVASIVGTSTYSNFTISMGCTPDTSADTWKTGLSLALAPVTHTVVVGQNVHTLSNPYIWNGTDNLVVEICFNNSGFTNNSAIKYTTSAFNSVRYYRADISTVCSNVSSVTGTSANRPNTVFSFCTPSSDPYSYSWSNGSTSNSATGLAAGTHYLSVTDGLGCLFVDSVSIADPAPLVVNDTVIDVSCFGGSDGSIGFTSSYFNYLWSTGDTTSSITGLSAGTYYFTLTNSTGCAISDSATVGQVAALVSSAVVDSNISCNGLSDGGASASASGGTAPYTYLWSNAATTASITGVVAGTYTVSITDANACSNSNTVVITEPGALNAISQLDSHVTCFGGSDGAISVITVGGTAPYTYIWSNGGTSASVGGLSAGTYTVTVTDANGCSDTDNRLITQPAILTGSMSVTACDSYTWMSNGMNYTTSGTYIDTVQNAAGCDSIVTLSLSINNSSSSSATILVCDAGFYFWGGDTLRSSGTYLDTIANGVGCDSLMTLNLTLSNTAITQLTDTVCDWTISAGGDTLTMTGLYSDTLSTMAGCDSIITLNLLVKNSSDTLFTASACDSYIWAITGDTLTASGNYSDTISNAAGCDSVIWLDLTIINPSLTVVNDTACDVYVWTNTGDTLMSTGSYYDTLSNVAGCDSIIQLDLLINNSSNDTTVAAACDSYTWAENGQTYTQSGLYLETRTNAAGCDSILSLDLIITNIDSTVVNTGDSVFAFSSGLAYQWLNCDSTALAVPGMIAGATNRGYRPDTTGNFAVIIYNGSCVDTSSCTRVTYIGLGETKGAANSFSIYPNPTKNNFKVAFDQTIANGPLQVFNMEGKLVYEVQQVRSGQSIEIDGLSEGLYTVRFNNQFKKLIVTD